MILGLAGKSGSGKNLLSTYLERKGFRHFDLDLRAHKVLDESAEQLSRTFGGEILHSNGMVDRKKLGALVFSDPEKKQKLQNILYPILEEGIREELKKEDKAVLNGALLSESGLPEICDRLIWLKSPFITRFFRLIKRDKRTIREIIKRMSSQKALKPQLFSGRVDIQIIVNRDNPEKMFRQTDLFLESLKDKGSSNDC